MNVHNIYIYKFWLYKEHDFIKIYVLYLEINKCRALEMYVLYIQISNTNTYYTRQYITILYVWFISQLAVSSFEINLN